jgi:hypothetical protein
MASILSLERTSSFRFLDINSSVLLNCPKQASYGKLRSGYVSLTDIFHLNKTNAFHQVCQISNGDRTPYSI